MKEFLFALNEPLKHPNQRIAGALRLFHALHSIQAAPPPLDRIDDRIDGFMSGALMPEFQKKAQLTPSEPPSCTLPEA